MARKAPNGRYWTDDEVRVLREMYAARRTLADMAAALGRTDRSCQQKLREWEKPAQAKREVEIGDTVWVDAGIHGWRSVKVVKIVNPNFLAKNVINYRLDVRRDGDDRALFVLRPRNRFLTESEFLKLHQKGNDSGQ